MKKILISSLIIVLILCIITGVVLTRIKNKLQNNNSIFADGTILCDEISPCKNHKIKSIKLILPGGARAHFSKDGSKLVFDKSEDNRYYGVFTSDLEGKNVKNVLEGVDGLNKNNGNATFDPSGQYVLFSSQEDDTF